MDSPMEALILLRANGRIAASEILPIWSRETPPPLALIFGEGIFIFVTRSPESLKDTLDLGGGYVLDIEGTAQPDGKAGNYIVIAVGHGRPNTVTAGWEYDYRAELAYHWQNGVNQIPALVGSVIRAKAHDGGAAGYVASFVAVRHL